MGNRIYFAGSASGPVQEDAVNKNESVKFYCDERFRIIFEADAKAYMEENPSIGWFAASVGQPLVFESEPVYQNRDDEWVVKIKFSELPSAGLKYTVELHSGGQPLDPRVVPPRIS